MAGPNVTTQAGLGLRFTVRERWEFDEAARLDLRALSAAFCLAVPKCLICLSDILRRFGGLARGLRLVLRGLLALVASRLTLVVVMTFHPVEFVPLTGRSNADALPRPGPYRPKA